LGLQVARVVNQGVVRFQGGGAMRILKAIFFTLLFLFSSGSICSQSRLNFGFDCSGAASSSGQRAFSTKETVEGIQNSLTQEKSVDKLTVRVPAGPPKRISRNGWPPMSP